MRKVDFKAMLRKGAEAKFWERLRMKIRPNIWMSNCLRASSSNGMSQIYSLKRPPQSAALAV